MVGLSVLVIETAADFDLLESLMRGEVTSVHSAASEAREPQRYGAQVTHLPGPKTVKDKRR